MLAKRWLRGRCVLLGVESEVALDENDSITVIIGGDIVPIGAGVSAFNEAELDDLIEKELLDLIHRGDFSIFNLETPLADKLSPIAKCGPNLIAPTQSIRGLTAINPGVFALANNHIFDQGEQGLFSTIQTLAEAKAGYLGAGSKLSEASRPYVFESRGIKVGFYACAEHEFSIASDSSPGANPFDPLESLDHVVELKKSCDFVCVLYHGGKEHYRYPSPMLQKICRKIAEKGADLVVCQHSHCVGCEERWGDSIIVYGQGNFLFDHSESEFWKTGLLISVSVEKTAFHVQYYPIQKNGIGVSLAHGDNRKEIMNGFSARSLEIMNQGFVESSYSHFADSMLDGYLSSFIPGGKTILFRFLNKLLGHRIALLLGSRARFLCNENFIECEAHRELFVAGLKRKNKDLK